MKKSKPNISTSKASKIAFAAAIEKYLDKRTRTLKKNIEAAERYYGIDAIHDLRVEIKRIRALYHLIHAVVPSFNAERHTLSMRKLFKKAGMLRDIDIQQEIVRRGHEKFDLSEYLNYLKKQELLLRPELVLACRDLHMQTLKSNRTTVLKAIAKLSQDQLQAKIGTYADSTLKKIKKLSQRKTQSSQCLHDIRKLTKVARYTLDVWKLGVGTSVQIEKALKELKSAATLLGEWRDTVIASESLQSYLEHDAPKTVFSPGGYTKFLQLLELREENLLARYYRSSRALSGVTTKFDINRKRTAYSKRRS